MNKIKALLCSGVLFAILLPSGANWGKALKVVKLSGKTNHFGIDITTGKYIDSQRHGHGDPVHRSRLLRVRDEAVRRGLLPGRRRLPERHGGHGRQVVGEHARRPTAAKPGVAYPTVKFKIDAADAANGVQLYIASPPDSLEGSNSSGPGQP